jgi:hypothetical protein
MHTKHIRSTLAAALAMTAGLAQAQTSASETRLEFAQATKSMTEVRTGPDRTNLFLVAEGAGKFTVQGTVVPVYVLCGAVDTIVEGHKTVYAGVGDCEFKSAAGGVLYTHFQTPEGKGDRTRMTFSGGTLDLARFNGVTIPMLAIINPRMVGKTVFYFDTVDDKVIGQ